MFEKRRTAEPRPFCIPPAKRTGITLPGIVGPFFFCLPKPNAATLALGSRLLLKPGREPREQFQPEKIMACCFAGGRGEANGRRLRHPRTESECGGMGFRGSAPRPTGKAVKFLNTAPHSGASSRSFSPTITTPRMCKALRVDTRGH